MLIMVMFFSNDGVCCCVVGESGWINVVVSKVVFGSEFMIVIFVFFSVVICCEWYCGLCLVFVIVVMVYSGWLFKCVV